MHELNSGKFFGSDIKNRDVGGIWASLACYDETLLRRSAKNHSNAWHVHQNPHFSFILEGGNVERRKSGEAECRPGQIRFYHAGEPHQNVNVLYPSKNFNVEIDARFLSRYEISESAVESAFFNASGADLSNIKFTMLRIYEETICRSEVYEMAVHSLILGIISKKKTPAGESLKKPRWADKVIQILREQWNENLTLQELSEAAGVHPITISKHFPKYFSYTLGEYIRRLRVEKSLGLIKQSDNSLTQIAHDCGFSDQSHFTRVFKDLTGLKPNFFRKI